MKAPVPATQSSLVSAEWMEADDAFLRGPGGAESSVARVWFPQRFRASHGGWESRPHGDPLHALFQQSLLCPIGAGRRVASILRSGCFETLVMTAAREYLLLRAEPKARGPCRLLGRSGEAPTARRERTESEFCQNV